MKYVPQIASSLAITSLVDLRLTNLIMKFIFKNTVVIQDT